MNALPITERIFSGTLDAAKKVVLLLEEHEVTAAIVHLPFQSPQCVEGTHNVAIRFAEVHVQRYARAAAESVLKMHRKAVMEWSGFPLEGAPVEDDPRGKIPGA